MDSEGQSHAEWLDSYAEFVLLRLQSFSPDLSDLAAVDSETSLEDASRSLEKVKKSGSGVKTKITRKRKGRAPTPQEQHARMNRQAHGFCRGSGFLCG